DVLMLDGLHVFDVIVQAQQVAEAEHGKHFYGRLLLAYELRFHSFQPQMTGNINNLADQRARQTPAAILRENQDANPANVAFPASQLLVERDVPHDLAVHQSEQREISP